jgi:hypothetical protein
LLVVVVVAYSLSFLKIYVKQFCDYSTTIN